MDFQVDGILSLYASLPTFRIIGNGPIHLVNNFLKVDLYYNVPHPPTLSLHLSASLPVSS